MPRITRYLLASVATLLLATAVVPSARAQMQRKDIEDLSTDELNRYKNAIKKLKDSGRFAEFAKLHNGPGGMSLPFCQHRNELFFPWHRSLLYSFEKALQAIDPGVTIPYWRWTVAPRAGGRYPAAFVEGGSANPLWFNRSKTSTEPPLFKEAELVQAIKDNQQWNAFAGAKKGDPPAFGALEQPFHNDIHDWCGRPMENPRTAAQDPIFWSFHAYIDYIWYRWQKQWPNEPVGCLDCDLRNLTEKRLVSDVIDIERQLNYTYVPSTQEPSSIETSRLGIAAPRTMARAPGQEAVRDEEVSLKAVRPARQSGPFVYRITVPDPGFSTAHIHIADIDLPETVSYSGAIYLYPVGVALAPNNPEFRKRYFVARISIWREPEGDAADHAEHGDAGKVNVYANATTEFRYLSKTQPGSAWNIAIVIDPTDPLSAEERRATAGERRLPLSQEIKFGEVTVALDHFLRR